MKPSTKLPSEIISGNDRKKFLETRLNPEQKVQQENEIETKQFPKINLEKNEDDLLNWLVEWQKVLNLNFPLESKHFFLEGEHLDALARALIGRAENQILVTNPYIDTCHLTNALLNALKKVEIKAISRRPADLTKKKCQKELKEAGMHIHYYNQIHAKIIVIDNKIAIVSSMNLYTASSGGFTKEAGIVSIDQKIVNSVSKYIQELLEKDESVEECYH